MNKTDFLQDLHLFFLAVLLSGLAATDYFVNHATPLNLPQAELKMPKIDLESNAIFGNFKSPNRTPSSEVYNCAPQSNKDEHFALRC